MNYDINVLWIEDTGNWLNPTKDLFMEQIEDIGLLTNIRTITNKKEIRKLPDIINREAVGFKIYDIIFVDYNISGENITGDNLIKIFRKEGIDADILFYSDKLTQSSQKEKMKAFEFSGVYLSSKDSFIRDALYLYKKNSRKLTSLLNIRGLLMDKTSENDYVIKSYLLEKFDNLPDNVKKQIFITITQQLKEKIMWAKNSIEKAEKLVNKNEYTIKKLTGLPDFIFPIKDKYTLFADILSLLHNEKFKTLSFDDYKNTIIRTRNNVAHKKIETCNKQKYLKYYDDLQEYKDRMCPDDCVNHKDDNKISIDEWQNVLKLANEYSKLFDEVLSELEKEYNIK